MKDLENDPNVNWQGMTAIHKEWSEKHEGLSGPASAVIMVAIAVATQGTGAGLMGASGHMATMANAGFTGLVSQASLALINNKGNPLGALSDLMTVDTVRSLAASIITAGLVDKFGGGQLPLRPQNISAPDLMKHLQQELISAGIKTGVGVVIGGENLNDAVKGNLVFASAAVFGASFSQQIGKYIKAGEINKAQQLIAHGLVGCVSAAIGGANCGGAATGAVLGEFISDLAHNGAGLDKDQSATLGRYAALASSLLTANKALDVTYTNLAASNAISNNFLLPDQKQELAKKLTACGEDTACKDVVTKPYKEISDKKDAEFQKAYAACKLGLGCETFYAIHYGLRLEVTKEGNEYYKNHAADFIQLPEEMAVFHTYPTDTNGNVVDSLWRAVNYTKYIHPVLGYEVVLDKNGNIITDPVNAGTYNFYNPGDHQEFCVKGG